VSGVPRPDAVEVGPHDATASVIWLHGLGADGWDFYPVVPELGLPAGLPVRFVFPHAPHRAVTLNGGMTMRAWYDIAALDLDARSHDAAGIRASEALVLGFVEREIARGVAPGRIVLAGFSQGGALTIHAALRAPWRLAGAIALSCYLLKSLFVKSELVA
jgi:phospholipase/carboxylesterase